MADDFERQFFQEQVREWAYSSWTTLDDYGLDDYKLHHVELLPFLFELIADHACPQRESVLQIVEDFTRHRALHRLAVQPELIQAIQDASASGHSDLVAWSGYATRVLQTYRQTPFRVKQALAIEMGENLLLGPRKLALIRAQSQAHDQVTFKTLSSRYWELYAPIMGTYQTYLYINQASGSYIALFTIRLTAAQLDRIPWDRPLTYDEIRQLQKDSRDTI